MTKFHDALQVRTYFRTGRESDLPVNVTPELAEAVRKSIRRQGFVPGDVTAEKIIDVLDFTADIREERAAGC